MHPLLVKSLMLPLHERLKGKRTFQWLRTLERTQWLSLEELRAFQLERLRHHLRFAYDHVPYYRRLLDEHGLPPHRVTTLEDFSGIPPLTRQAVRDHFDALQARPQLGRLQRIATGGSTGVPVTVLVDMERMGFGEAARLRSHRWFGPEPGAREVVLWGSPVELTRQDRVRNFRDHLINSRLLSAFDLSERALTEYGAFIRRYRPQKMFGYASAFYLLASYLEATRWRAPGTLRAIFTTAEPLFDFQRKKIECVFECPTATEYGSRDGGMAANECPKGGLHIPIEGMHVEILGDHGGGIGEIVVTILDSFAFPIIRYRTGDLGSLSQAPCPCGRNLPCLKSVEGRLTDFIVTPDGRCLHALAVIYPLRETPHVREFQFVQETADHVTVTLVPDLGFSHDNEREVRSQLAARLGPRVRIEIERVAEIERSPSGKFRYVVSNVARQHVESLLARQRV
jgi:phenylacetate-CoA ligase